MLKKCLGDSALILPIEGLGVEEDFSYEEVPLKISDRHKQGGCHNKGIMEESSC